MKKPFIWKLLLVAGLCPFIAPFAYYLILIYVHNSHDFTLSELVVLWSYVYWPTYIAGAALTGVSTYKLKK